MSDNPKGEESKGRLKEAAGAVTGDDDMKREGQTDQKSAQTKQKVNEGIDKVKNAVNKDR